MSLLPLRRALRGEIKKPSPEDPKFVNESLRTSLPPASCQKSYISVGQISTGPFVLPSLSALKCPLDTCPSLARPWLGHSFQRTAPTSFHSCAKLSSASAPSSSHPPTLLLQLGEGPAALQYLCWAGGPPSLQQPAGDLEAAHPSWPCYEWEKWKSSGGELPMAESLWVAHVINDSVFCLSR